MESERAIGSAPKTVGRYAVHEEIASGGMATVHFGRLLGPVGFSRTVAIKRLHPQLAKDPDFAAMFLDEARLAARIHHPNVVQTLDVVALEGELFLVLEYVQGESLAKLIRASRTAKQTIPLPIVSAILCGALQGLHAAHDATNEQGEPLHLVHRDVSPQNLLVGADGVTRVLDFGVAKAVGRIHTTGDGQLKGKIPYMAPEQVVNSSVDRRTDVFAAGSVLWETLTLQRLFTADNEAAVLAAVLDRPVSPPSSVAAYVPPELDGICMRALDRDPEKRFKDAWEFALALEACVVPATTARVSEWVKSLAGQILSKRAETVARIESSGSGLKSSPPPESEVPHSQVSSISVSSPRTEGRPVRLGYLALMVGVLVVALGAITLWRNAKVPEESHAAASGSVISAPLPPVPSTSTATVASTFDAPVVSSVVSASPVRPRAAAPQPSAARPHPSAAVQCEPPYTIDSAGHRQYKPECL